MGREIRRVPKGWEHPRNKHGHYKPMWDETYEMAAQKWLQELFKWEDGSHPDRKEAEEMGCRYVWDWHGGPPDKDQYRPEFADEPNSYQIYENVSEGTPVSPIFETKEEMLEWLIKQGYSAEAAKIFIENEYVPTAAIEGGRIIWDIEMFKPSKKE